jgi:hypothetical protein
MRKIYKTLAYYKASDTIKRDGVVKIDQAGNISCNCPVWIFHLVNGLRSCEHTIAAREDFGDKIQAVKDYGLCSMESPLVSI